MEGNKMEIISWVNSLLVDYGAVNVIIMFLVIVITNLIKKPIINKADTFVKQAKTLLDVDVDKSVITSNIVYIPIGVALVLYTLWNIIYVGFDFTQIVWSAVISDSLVYGMLSISVFDILKNKLKAYISKNAYKDAKEKLDTLTKKAFSEKGIEQPVAQKQEVNEETLEELE